LINKPNLILGQIVYLISNMIVETRRTNEEIEKIYNILNIDIKTIQSNLKPLSNSLNLLHPLYLMNVYFKPLSNSLNLLHPLYLMNVYFIIGIIEGDGSFYIGLRVNKKIRFGFNITTHSKEIEEIDLLYKIK
jgi:hypothetical protein